MKKDMGTLIFENILKKTPSWFGSFNPRDIELKMQPF